jgi:SPP1 gp7 family putative phage head morphogenesis protein
MPDMEQLRLDFGSDWAKVMARFYPLILGSAFENAGVELGMGLAFDLDNPLIQETLADLGLLIRRVADTTIEEVQALVGRGAAEGWSNERLAEELGKLAEIRSPERALLIARTETAAAYSRGSLLAYQQSGVVEQVEWLATLDADTSAECRALHGTRRPLDGEFADGTLHPPRHPRCRCALVPIV